MRAPARLLLGLSVAAAVAGGCDWRAFDTLRNETPVLRIDPPSDYPSSNDFGGLLVPLGPPADGSEAAWFLSSAVSQTALAITKINPAGGAAVSLVKSTALDDLMGTAITAMAAIPGTSVALLGAPTSVGGSLLTVDLATSLVTPFNPTSLVGFTEGHFGMGVAAANFGGGAAPDLVAASAVSVHVFVDGSAASDLAPTSADLASCPIALALASLPTAERNSRALAVGALTGGAPVIAIGTPVAAGAGSVSIFTVDATAGKVSCAFVLTAPSAADSRFGQSLASFDFNGDSIPDLLVGDPPGRVYFYKGPLAAGVGASGTITGPAGSLDFGAAVTALNLDGKPNDEILVADPQATVNGVDNAGDVVIYSGSAPLPVEPLLADHDPGSSEAYGTALAALPFCALPPCVAPPRAPLVGGPGAIFVYLDLNMNDLRAK